MEEELFAPETGEVIEHSAIGEQAPESKVVQEFETPEGMEKKVTEEKEKEEVDYNNFEFDDVLQQIGVEDEELKAEIVAKKEQLGLDNEDAVRLYEYESELVEQKNAQLDAELAKLTEAEREELPELYETAMTMVPEGAEGIVDAFFATASGARFFKEILDGFNEELPVENNNRIEPKSTFTMTEYNNYTQEINEAARNMDYQLVENLKKDLKHNILTRGTPAIKADLGAFLKN